MTLKELERKIEVLRSEPLVLLCRTPAGKEQVMTMQRCKETGSTFIHVVLDDLDVLLERELGGE